MLVMPDTTVRVANAEAVSLELDVSAQMVAVQLLPRMGEAQTIQLVEGSFTFPTFLPPDVVEVRWLSASDSDEAAFTSSVEVVSRHYFDLQQLRLYGDGQDDFDDAAKYPDDRLYEVRQAATEAFEHAANRCFVKRIGCTMDYGRDALLTLHHVDVSQMLSDGYVMVSDCQLERDPNFFGQSFPRPIEYQYGMPNVPAKVSEAVLTLAAYYLRPSNTADRATGESSDAGFIHFTLAGINGATSLPEVNATAEQFGRKGPMAW